MEGFPHCGGNQGALLAGCRELLVLGLSGDKEAGQEQGGREEEGESSTKQHSVSVLPCFATMAESRTCYVRTSVGGTMSDSETVR